MLLTIIALLMGQFSLSQTAWANEVVLLRQPYIQQLTPTSLMVVWTTNVEVPSEVRYGVGSLTKTAVATTTFLTTSADPPYDIYYTHTATLTDLIPNTLYQYQILSAGENLTPNGTNSVRSGKPTSTTSFRFAAVGDTRKEVLETNGVIDRLLQIQPDLVVHAGDYAYDEASYELLEVRYFQAFADLIDSIWVATAIGNNDMEYNGGYSFVDLFANPTNGATDPLEAELYYSFDYANAHFVVLASVLPLGPGSTQYEWLQQDLAATSQPWKFVVVHDSAYYTDSSQQLQIGNQDIQTHLVPLFEAEDVDVVISAGVNFYERMKPMIEGDLAPVDEGGVLYVTTGSAGVGLRDIGEPPWHARTAHKEEMHHLVIFDVDDCELTLTAVSGEDGDFEASDAFDTYTINHCQSGPNADFVSNIQSGAAPLTVDFTDLSSGHPDSWTWNLGNGRSAWGQYPTHIYTEPGTYTVDLTVRNPFGSHTKSRPSYIVVTEPPETNFYFSQTNYDVVETGSPSVTVSVEATWPPSEPMTVAYESSGNSATAGSDYEAISGTLRFDVGESVQSFVVPILDDNIVESLESLTLTLRDGAVTEPSTAMLSIFDDDGPSGVRFTQTNYPALEASGQVTVTVALMEPLTQTVTVEVETADSTATSADYVPITETLSFAPGDTIQSFVVTLLDDAFIEEDETIDLILRNPVGTILAEPKTAVLTIQNDDTLPYVQFDEASTVIDEVAGVAYVSVRLTKPFDEAVTVDYATEDGNANAGNDYEARSGSLRFRPWQTTQVFTVPILDDGLVEPLEAIHLRLDNPNNGELGNPRTAVLHIADNDNLPQFRFSASNVTIVESAGWAAFDVVIDQASFKTSLVDYEIVAETAVSDEDYIASSGTLTFVAGKSRQSFTIPIRNDDLDETLETATVRLTNPRGGVLVEPSEATLTIIDDDEPPQVQFSSSSFAGTEGHSVLITVTLATPSGREVWVDYVTTSGTAVGGSDYDAVAGTLIFAPGETSQVIGLPLHADGVVEGGETFQITLVNALFSTLNTPNPAVVTIWDNDNLPTLQFDSAAYTVDEGSKTAVIPVTLSGSSEQIVTVNVVTFDQTAVAGSDYTPTTTALVFPPGTTEQLVAIPILDDTTDEFDERLTVVLRDWHNGAAGQQTVTNLIIADDDEPPEVDFASEAFGQNEAGGAKAITVQLSEPSAKLVTFSVVVADGTAQAPDDYAPVTRTLTIPAGDTTADFSILLTDDSRDEPPETVLLTLTALQNGMLGSLATAVLTIEDDDEPPLLGFVETAVSVPESAPAVELQLALAAPSQQIVRASYVAHSISATQGGDFATTSGLLTFLPGEISQTLTIPLFDDDWMEPDETFVVALTPLEHAAVGDASEVVVVLEDDDGPTVGFAETAVSVSEASGQATVVAELSQTLTQPVTVTYRSEAGTATSLADYIPVSGSLVFPTGTTTQTVTIPIQQDRLDEIDETFMLLLELPAGVGLNDQSTATVSIIDDDPAPLLGFTSDRYPVRESSGEAMVTLVLSASSAQTVTVKLATVGGTAVPNLDYTPVFTTVTFVPGTVSRTITIPLLADNLAEQPETIEVKLAELVNGAWGDVKTAVVTIRDSNTPTIYLPIVTRP